jgi:phosphoglycerol transferase MdoB-like AlkP superfamily enzyme
LALGCFSVDRTALGFTRPLVRHRHSARNRDDQRVPILLFGRGIRKGEYRQAASPADIAPTLAALSGITLPQAEGRVLTEALGN